MQTFVEFKKQKLMIESIGVYYRDETTQKIGYYIDGIIEPKNFVEVCIIKINCPYQYTIVAAIKNEIKNFTS